jgi:hypothetical protein
MATLEARLIALAQAVGADIKTARLARGDLTALSTTTQANLVATINEVRSLALSASGAQINDTAGNGATTVTWSADKIFDELTLAINTLRTELRAGAGAALDTFNELATALGNDPNFASTIATGLGNRVRADAAQTFTAPQQLQARSNIGAQSAADVGNTDNDLAAVYVTAKT